MAPKKATGAAAATKKTSSSHASYKDMIKEAILNLKERNGSSRQAIKKYVKSNNKDLKYSSETQFDQLFNKALRSGVEKGEFTQPKGTSGPVKLAKKEASAEKKTVAKKESATKEAKPAAAKKAAPKKSETKATTKTATKKAPVKKTTATTKAKANTAKPRTKTATKTEAPAPAVTDTPTVLKKTKSGRVTKQKAPATKKAATTKKAAAPKKKATPKKAEAAS